MEKKPAKRYLSILQITCLAGRLHEFANAHKVKWETVYDQIVQMVKEKNKGYISYEDICKEGFKIILESKNEKEVQVTSI